MGVAYQAIDPCARPLIARPDNRETRRDPGGAHRPVAGRRTGAVVDGPEARPARPPVGARQRDRASIGRDGTAEPTK